MCQILIFLEVTNVSVDKSKDLVPGKYALIHFVNEDVFGNVPRNSLYDTKYPHFCIDDSCACEGMGKENEYDFKSSSST